MDSQQGSSSLMLATALGNFRFLLAVQREQWYGDIVAPRHQRLMIGSHQTQQVAVMSWAQASEPLCRKPTPHQSGG